MKFLLKGKWVLITGASSGFGAAAAKAFGGEGAKLLLGARRVDRLEKAATEAKAAGAGEAHFHFLDVAKAASVEEFISFAREKISGSNLHVLVNNAGGALGLDSVSEGKEEDWEGMIQSNFLGLLRMTRAALPLMPHDAGASIINIGSIAGRAPYEGASVYGGAKAAELHATRVLRLELNGTGIRVSSIDPGMVKTDFSLVRFKGDAARAEKVYEGTVPLTAEDIADIMVWVASRPPHVCIDELLVKPVDQAAMHKIYRRKN